MSDNLTSKDLRIGNLILNEYGIVSTIVEITDYDRVAVGNNRVVTDLVNCEPIPLTEEWLLRFGFQKEFESDVAIFYENDFLSINIYKGYNSTFLKRNRLINQQDYSINNIKYVHQLQSLYYMLTQRELL